MPKYTLTYFDGEGLGESIRLLLSYGKIEFTDIRLDFEKDWEGHKKSTPFAQLPLLEIDGKVLHQSVAIGRYVAKLVGLYSDDPLEAYEIDAIIDSINDFKAKLSAAHYETDEKVKATKWEALKAETIPFYLGKFEAIAAENEGHLALKRLTYADVYLTGLKTYLKSILNEDLGAKCPSLKKVVENVKAQDGIKQWIEKKPKSDW